MLSSGWRALRQALRRAACQASASFPGLARPLRQAVPNLAASVLRGFVACAGSSQYHYLHYFF